ncbi:hypothetical protein [Brachybacterium nesterenkovii]|uniref:hypothetical protein n=1 Tax=Brachybacterium nesterenkovii TaxID=47847 RepID=UPI00321BB60B
MSRLLASMVAVRLDGHDPAVCAAWIDSADRVCGRPVVAPWLCKRHETVARKRAEKAGIKAREDAEKHSTRQEELRPGREARLAVVQAEIDRLDPPRQMHEWRHMTDRQAAHLSQLYRERDDLRRDLGVTA